ncbi:MAG TPA: hypothetical protein VHG51_11605 [Longimicrobiaceae bacterium]|nr:hypothetical protein [Longimicrobiaceae bacterium]
MAKQPLTIEEALRRQKRLLVYGGVILGVQVVYTAVLWVSTGRFPIWAALAVLGVYIFHAMLLRQHRRLRAMAQQQSPDPPKKKRRRLRDPHRKPPAR